MPGNHQQSDEHGYRLLAIGTDIEVFLRNKVTKESIPVCGLLGGTKQEPLAVPSLGEGFYVQEDNVAAEFNIPAALDKESFICALDDMKYHLADHFNKQGLELDISPSAMFSRGQLANRQAQTFGCDPDYCVWTLSENEMDTSNPLLRRMRTAGGHIHVSFLKDGKMPELADTFLVIKALDLFLGVPSILIDHDMRRREIYGKAGAFRPKQYSADVSGVEYRTLSNFWFQDRTLISYIFKGVRSAMKYINNAPNAEEHIDSCKDQILLAINGGNTEAAQMLIQNHGLAMPQYHSGSILSASNFMQYANLAPNYIITDDLEETHEDDDSID